MLKSFVFKLVSDIITSDFQTNYPDGCVESELMKRNDLGSNDVLKQSGGNRNRRLMT